MTVQKKCPRLFKAKLSYCVQKSKILTYKENNNKKFQGPLTLICYLTLGLPDTYKLMFAIGSSMEKKDEEFGKKIEKLSIVVRRAYFD